MSHIRSVALVAVAGAAMIPNFVQQDASPIDAAKLREIIAGLGYEVKPLNEEPGKEKYEFTVKTEKFDIPMAAEISGSKNYIWLTVYLGDAPAEDSPKCRALLNRNFKIQPTQFYITDKGALMMGFAMENRGMNQDVFKRTYSKLASDVTNTSDVWSGSVAPEWAD